MEKQRPQTVDDWIAYVEQRLYGHPLYYGHGTDNAGDEAAWLVTHIASADTGESIDLDMPVSSNQAETITTILSKRIELQTPLAYLLKQAWFAGYPFYVDERVLVPRSPIAELILNSFEPLLTSRPRRILDLCCGSGCIGIAAALQFPESEVCLADNSAAALEVTAANLDRFNLADRVSTCKSDLFENISGEFDLILSNPPYVSREEYAELPAEFHREPEVGLVSENHGLELPLKILQQSPQYLSDKGILILETGYTWPLLEDATAKLYKLWLDFEYGGEGVCAISAADLASYSNTG